ncbi:hypothetical protein A2U01_0090779, partial [Trifolium medium]|nr:hypothetical protein [Trifolium medium]
KDASTGRSKRTMVGDSTMVDDSQRGVEEGGGSSRQVEEV